MSIWCASCCTHTLIASHCCCSHICLLSATTSSSTSPTEQPFESTHCHQAPVKSTVWLCFQSQQSVSEALCSWFVHVVICLSTVCLLTPISSDTFLYLVMGFQQNLPQLFIMPVGKLKRFSGSKVKDQSGPAFLFHLVCIQTCEWYNGTGKHFDSVA